MSKEEIRKRVERLKELQMEILESVAEAERIVSECTTAELQPARRGWIKDIKKAIEYEDEPSDRYTLNDTICNLEALSS